MTLERIIYNEYNTELCEENENAEKVTEMVRGLFDDAQMEQFTLALVRAEKYIFTQGFLRGIAANMAGAI